MLTCRLRNGDLAEGESLEFVEMFLFDLSHAL